MRLRRHMMDAGPPGYVVTDLPTLQRMPGFFQPDRPRAIRLEAASIAPGPRAALERRFNVHYRACGCMPAALSLCGAIALLASLGPGGEVALGHRLPASLLGVVVFLFSAAIVGKALGLSLAYLGYRRTRRLVERLLAGSRPG